MAIERKEQGGNNPGSKRTIIASLSALGGIVLASGCCLPLAPFLLAAGTAGSSVFFLKLRPFLLAGSVLSIGFGFYESWRANCPFLILFANSIPLNVTSAFPNVLNHSIG